MSNIRSYNITISLLLEEFIIGLNCLFSCFIMLQYWGWVFYTLFMVLLVSFKPVVDVFVWYSLKFWYPFLYVYALLVVIFLLWPRIEYSKIRSSISPISYSPLPTSRILHRRIINKFTGKVSFSFMPIQE